MSLEFLYQQTRDTTYTSQKTGDPAKQIPNTIAALYVLSARYGNAYGYGGWADALSGYNAGCSVAKTSERGQKYAADVLACEKCLLEGQGDNAGKNCPSQDLLDKCLPLAEGKK